MPSDNPTTATYLWPDSRPFPDAIMLKDASALTPEGRSARVESYGLNARHYARETAYAELVTWMYVTLMHESVAEEELAAFAEKMAELGLEVPHD